ncbi:MAG: hypothetical protein WCS92_02985 [Candidatus Babeliales bacterium]|jgi:hypothetical protein|nr:MAG: hypothetical protein US22_C0019G0005 [candidate division TM6 bacterium GW2011_GWF2_36_6]
MNKFLVAVAIVVIGGACYAKNPPTTRRSDGPSTGSTSAYPGFMGRMGLGFEGKNKAIMDTRKKLFELKKFKWETMRQNLKIDTKEFAGIINKKIDDLKLSSKTFDSLRKSAKTNRERMCINKLENKFLRFQMMLKFLGEGCPALKEKMRDMEAPIATEE